MSVKQIIDPEILARNIMAVLRRSEAVDAAEGANWYPEAYRAIQGLSERHKVSFDTAAAVVAVLSPQLRWTRNILAAEAALSGYHLPGVLGTSYRKAVRIIAGENPLDVLGGPKVNAFYQNLRGDFQSVTIDTHAISIACGHSITVNKNTIKAGRYEAFAEAYRIVARWVGQAPAIVQAITWVTWKRLFYSKSDFALRHPATA